MSIEQLTRAVDLLANQVGHWTPARWRDQGEPLHKLIQRLADQAADLSGAPRHDVPRLSDLALPDQLRVVVADLAAAAPPDEITSAAADELAALRHTLT
ncbi:hypothetical protein [Catellatospora citrea]|uniref:Uncharacterized protein n=1 Tax=Catellatospora citrea TaxID=53366 RepID=A0A8J3P046_9ACTN|nr:hypothetical protein [Catellatospora citrea]RKE08120.1 hypothetical protein C8E86_2963 [Catellatospora citrea]GIF98501.1 hypothetical protein Cci01nite_35950 [Catellatospora citrea]